MTDELPTRFDHRATEAAIYERWLETDAFAAIPDDRDERYVIMMPLPNVTGALHMGHAMDNVMQDLLIRWHRMLGDNTLWMPGTDHAGIATQAVVEKRLYELEGKTRHDLGRQVLVERIWQWKDQYQRRIVRQQQQMGCSCDWQRQRFTMDAVCAAAVRRTFFNLFADRLIYRGYRLVNWDCHLQTAVSDDEIIHEEVAGHFWHLRYPVIDPQPGEPEHVVVATTRPETMLGDTAVACHPEPGRAIEERIRTVRSRLESAGAKERGELEAELERLEERKTTHLPMLVTLAEMARSGRSVMLPLLDRPIPLVLDEWAKPELGSGCVKITPAHDPNDYEVWQRHPEIGAINILNADGTLAGSAGQYAGLDRFAARSQVVADLEARGLLESVAEHSVEIGHSDRSKTPIEPFLSKQWFVRMHNITGGIVCGRGTAKEFSAPGLAQAAIDATEGRWRSPSGRTVEFHPDGDRYRSTYTSWLGEKRDWCISRQLWWGHRIPVWHATFDTAEALDQAVAGLPDDPSVCAWITDPSGTQLSVGAGLNQARGGAVPAELQVCLADDAADERFADQLLAMGLEQDPDVLDTWFSSALWPFSTLGWPNPERAPIDPGDRPLGAGDGPCTPLAYYYPGSCLVTSRDIITLWVARMVMMGLYTLGDVPFTDVFIHAKILDGKGETMSKSKGNGIDPADIISRYGADAMRFVLCDMQTGTQDIRLPVQAICPAYDPQTHTNETVELAEAAHGRTIFTYLCPECGQEFDVLGTMDDLPAATIISDRFEVGRNFCTKLWNAARFTLLNLGEQHHWKPISPDRLADEDRWILSRLALAIEVVSSELAAYNPSAAISHAREFFWNDLCDWYLEMVKARLRAEGNAGDSVAARVLALALDQVLRLLHPFVPFITERLWERLNERAPIRGFEQPLPASNLLVTARWPAVHPDLRNPKLEEDMALLQAVVRAVRDVRNAYTVSPKTMLEVRIQAPDQTAQRIRKLQSHLTHLAGVERLTIGAELTRPPAAATRVVGNAELFVLGAVDPEAERARLGKQRDELTKQIAATEARLGNEQFVAKAPQQVVEGARTKLAELSAELERVEQSLAALDGA